MIKLFSEISFLEGKYNLFIAAFNILRINNSLFIYVLDVQ